MVLLPETGFVRLAQIIGSPKDGIPPLIPVGRSTWLHGVKTGRFPKSLKPFGPRVTCWRVEDIRRLIDQAGPAEDSSKSDGEPNQGQRDAGQ